MAAEFIASSAFATICKILKNVAQTQRTPSGLFRYRLPEKTDDLIINKLHWAIY